MLDTTKDIHITTNIVDRTTFGPTLTTFEYNRKFSNIELKINKKGKRASRTEYYFVLVMFGNVGNVVLP